MTHFLVLTPAIYLLTYLIISPERLKRELSNFVCVYSASLAITDYSVMVLVSVT